ncbi:MAG: hypothetical protein K8T26_09265 [Lentisphaerae bacterium]|nr:hypothetical protein [Lentisphaerota bacterium]
MATQPRVEYHPIEIDVPPKAYTRSEDTCTVSATTARPRDRADDKAPVIVLAGSQNVSPEYFYG